MGERAKTRLERHTPEQIVKKLRDGDAMPDSVTVCCCEFGTYQDQLGGKPR